jgi:hypothetical protein
VRTESNRFIFSGLISKSRRFSATPASFPFLR